MMLLSATISPTIIVIYIPHMNLFPVSALSVETGEYGFDLVILQTFHFLIFQDSSWPYVVIIV